LHGKIKAIRIIKVFIVIFNNNLKHAIFILKIYLNIKTIIIFASQEILES